MSILKKKSVEAPKEPPKPVYNGPRYDYKFLYPNGPVGSKWEEDFDALGQQGYMFLGTCSYGRSVFYKQITS